MVQILAVAVIQSQVKNGLKFVIFEISKNLNFRTNYHTAPRFWGLSSLNREFQERNQQQNRLHECAGFGRFPVERLIYTGLISNGRT